AIVAWHILSTRYQRVSIAYDGDLTAQGRRGLSILELSLLNDVPHAHVCNGRGRCGTCRVHVDAGGAQLSPLEDLERKTLERVGAGADDRLACQARVLGAGVAVTRLLPAFADASAARAPQGWTAAKGAPAGKTREWPAGGSTSSQGPRRASKRSAPTSRNRPPTRCRRSRPRAPRS